MTSTACATSRHAAPARPAGRRGARLRPSASCSGGAVQAQTLARRSFPNPGCGRRRGGQCARHRAKPTSPPAPTPTRTVAGRVAQGCGARSRLRATTAGLLAPAPPAWAAHKRSRAERPGHALGAPARACTVTGCCTNARSQRTRAEPARQRERSSRGRGEACRRRAVWKATAQAENLAPALLALAPRRWSPGSTPPGQRSRRRWSNCSTSAAGQRRAGDDDAGRCRQRGRQDRGSGPPALVLETPPLWQALADPEAQEPVSAGLRRSPAVERAFAIDYDAANARWLPTLAAVANLLLLPATVWLRHRAPARRQRRREHLSMRRAGAAVGGVAAAGAARRRGLRHPGADHPPAGGDDLAWIPVLALVRRRVL